MKLDGQALEDGMISFKPAAGTAARSAGCAIVAGDYHIPAERGLPAGDYVVQVESHQLTGKTYIDVIRGKQPEILPVRFSEPPGTVTVSDDGSNQFDFSLTSNGFVRDTPR